MQPGRWTELFFLDEATAFAAGHRPCAYCQRARYEEFRSLWAHANPELATGPRPEPTRSTLGCTLSAWIPDGSESRIRGHSKRFLMEPLLFTTIGPVSCAP